MRQMFETFLNLVSVPMTNLSSQTDAPTAVRVRFMMLGIMIVLAVGSALNVLPAAEKVDYQTQIKPLLELKCLGCHGPETQESHLRVDRKWSLLKGGDSGEPAIVELKSAESHLIQLVLGKDSSGKAMPPEPEDRLSTEEVSLLIRWIDEGAEWPGEFGQRENPDQTITHWSFQPVIRPQLPVIKNAAVAESAKAENGVDVWIQESLRTHQLSPNPVAPKRQRVRRLYLDVLGLPPTPEEMQAALAEDDTPETWQLLVEQVLESPHYGERWSRYWLDLVRFAETTGFETNRERPNAWPYRDYVIRSLNEDKPYHQFLREQLAGDSIGVPEATGYLVAGPYDIVKSPDINLTLMQRQNELDDMISTTSSVFVGLTVGCARCHNHKFDPISQKDYYGLQAVFAGVRHGDRAIPATEQRSQELASLRTEKIRMEDELRPYVKGPVFTRPALTPKMNEEQFSSTEARFVRFTIRQTNSSEPCVDELEVFSGETNVALAAAGGVPTSSGDLQGYPIHQLAHINDGIYGNSKSWISNQQGKGTVTIAWPDLQKIDRIRWGRDRDGAFADRLATEYVFELSVNGETWTEVASSAARPPMGNESAVTEYQLDSLAENERATVEQKIRRLSAVEQSIRNLEAMNLVYAGTFEQPEPTHRLFRGDPLAKREEVAPETITVLGTLGLTNNAPESERRLAFANWVASNENPLTARVICNRLWQFHFGKGLVATPGDFGVAGVAPTHPELLDWLAAELMDNNWSLKHIHRLILNSSTWQQSSVPREDALAIDAGTQYWWRFPPRRLEAEPIRDSILSVSGVLDRSVGGPGYSAFDVDLENVRHYFPRKSYGPTEWRRMIYMTKVRQEQDSVFGLFDCPDASTSVAARSRSTTPLQALNLFNSSFTLQQVEIFAKRLEAERPGSRKDQVELAWMLAFGRHPESEETHEATAFIEEEGIQAFCRAIFNSNEFLFID
ncbi:MAG: PSD1 domain-containing protein [Planctomyces sp.]|nr:PSD1 domain-containing protein [Planctomyces sp.]